MARIMPNKMWYMRSGSDLSRTAIDESYPTLPIPGFAHAMCEDLHRIAGSSGGTECPGRKIEAVEKPEVAQ
jgi:hypothetical protein